MISITMFACLAVTLAGLARATAKPAPVRVAAISGRKAR